MKQDVMYALGFFDGVHLGHQALLYACRELAGQGVAGVVTFTGHPDALVQGAAPNFINTPQDRYALLRSWGMDEIVELPFTKALKSMPWQDFYTLLRREYGAAGFVCGADFRFGAGGEGTASLLQARCRQDGLACRIVPQLSIDGQVVSSTYIRALLEDGKIRQANAFLGHPHCLSGKVISGKQLGRTLGIPTANLTYPPDLVRLPYGVYACMATVDGKRYQAVTNVGVRPTVSGQGVRVESWLMDFAGDLYGKTLHLDFHAFQRGEQKFENLAQLQAQIQDDALQMAKILKKI